MGGGGGGYIPPASSELQRKIEAAQKAERERLGEEVNKYLGNLLAKFNDRDVDRTQERLKAVSQTLSEGTEVETLLFGGSVAKHTYVDGLSDVDALVVLQKGGADDRSAKQVLDAFYRHLHDKLPRRDVDDIRKGTLAVTVSFRDGTELQLLPAIRTGSAVKIPDSQGKGWNRTNPKVFQRELSKQNARLNGALVPSIKLIKSLVADLPKQQRISGYHVEALAIDATRSYRGPKTTTAILSRVLTHASQRVRTPIQDVTGQSRVVDGYLGKADSSKRKLASQALSALARRLDSATSVTQWKGMFEGTER